VKPTLTVARVLRADAAPLRHAWLRPGDLVRSLPPSKP
jgi:hypothetical protein